MNNDIETICGYVNSSKEQRRKRLKNNVLHKKDTHNTKRIKFAKGKFDNNNNEYD